MASKVYFADLRADYHENLQQKLTRLMKTAGMGDIVTAKRGDLAHGTAPMRWLMLARGAMLIVFGIFHGPKLPEHV